MSNVKVNPAPEHEGRKDESAALALLDCGQASKETKGVPYLVWWEGGAPPFDRMLF